MRFKKERSFEKQRGEFAQYSLVIEGKIFDNVKR